MKNTASVLKAVRYIGNRLKGGKVNATIKSGIAAAAKE